MRHLIYHVAMTLDGFIAKADGSVPGFAPTGAHVDDYKTNLASYDAVVMGRATYEIGYVYGMKPGDKPYGDKQHYIFSESLQIPESAGLKLVRGNTLAHIDAIKQAPGGDIYLCGGGALAGYLLAHDRIDQLKIKLSPLVYGSGIRLFASDDLRKQFEFVSVKTYDSGVLLLDYRRPCSLV